MGKKLLNTNMVDSILGGVTNDIIKGKAETLDSNVLLQSETTPDIVDTTPIVDYVTMRIPKKIHYEMKLRALNQDIKVGELYKSVIEKYLNE